jgi:hypothetical protein
MVGPIGITGGGSSAPATKNEFSSVPITSPSLRLTVRRFCLQPYALFKSSAGITLRRLDFDDFRSIGITESVRRSHFSQNVILRGSPRAAFGLTAETSGSQDWSDNQVSRGTTKKKNAAVQ